MKWTVVGTLMLAIAMATGTTTQPVLSQNSPRPVYQPGPFQPVARFNPKQPVRVQVINQSGLALEYIVTTATGFRQLAPGGSTSFTIAQVPATLNINPARDRVGIRYTVSSANNTVTITVARVSSDGYRAIDFNEGGGIYVY